MRVQNNTILMFLTIMFVPVLIITPTDAFAVCDFQPDQPDCRCYIATDAAEWEPAGAFIQDVAIQTVGIRESCRCPGPFPCNWQPDPNDPNSKFTGSGRPYYQMVLGCSSEGSALSAAWLLLQLEEGGLLSDIYRRQAWCSETISYWHREAGIPYPGGYRIPGTITWQNDDIGDLKRWYLAEEDAGGRGRWIEPNDVNYVDFELGVTVPVPGAYVAIREYDCNDGWVPRGGAHSLMVDEMWVHEDVEGTVFQVEVRLLEGNNEAHVVDDSRRWDDILSLTPQGCDFINNNSKIWGFGIDLDSEGQPIYDPARLHWVSWPFTQAPPFVTHVEPNDPVWEYYYAPQIPKLVTYANMLLTTGGPNVTCSSPILQISGIPDGRSIQWHFPQGLPGGIEIDIDLMDVHPLLIKGIELTWDGNSVPPDYSVQYAASTPPQYQGAIIPDLNNMPLLSPLVPIPVPAIFTITGSGVEVRYVKLIFPNTFQQDAILQEIRFHYEQGPLTDTDLCQYTLVGDLNNDCRVGFSDFALMAANWLVDCMVNPDDPACVPE